MIQEIKRIEGAIDGKGIQGVERVVGGKGVRIFSVDSKKVGCETFDVEPILESAKKFHHETSSTELFCLL